MEIKLDTKGFEQLGLTIKELSRTIEKTTKEPAFLRSVGQILVGRPKQNLEDGGTGGKSYALLAPATKRQKQRKGFSAKPLQRTGLLKRSLAAEVSGGLKLKGLDILKHHQWGAPKANVPKREVYTIEEDDYADIQEILTRHIKNSIKK